MTFMRPPTPPFTLSAKGQADQAWLRAHLGTARVRGPVVDEEGDWEVELVRADGRRTWFFEGTPEKALARAREAVEAPPKNQRRAG